MAKLRIVILLGQSLASGVEGWPPLSSDSIAGHWMLGSNIGSSAGREGTFPIDVGAAPTPYLEPSSENILGGFARLMKTLHPSEEFAYLYCGISGSGMGDMDKGTAAYSKSLQQITAMVDFAKTKRLTPEFAVFLINGENDSAGYNNIPVGTFKGLVRNYLADISSDIRAIAGAVSPVKMFFSQTSSHGFYSQLAQTVTSCPSYPSAAIEQLELANENPDKFFMVAAKQDLPYASANSVHLNNIGYEQHGQKFAEVYDQVVFQGKTWKPLQLNKAFMKDATTLIASFDVPVGPLTFDETITDPGAKGFSLASGNTITKITIINSTQVEIKLATPYVSGVDYLRYAWDNFTRSGLSNGAGYPTNSMGKQHGARGNIQDSDAINGSPYNQANHCIHCSVVVFGLNANPSDPIDLRQLSIGGDLQELSRQNNR